MSPRAGLRLTALATAAAIAAAPGLAEGGDAARPRVKTASRAPAARRAPRAVAASRAWHTPTPGKAAPTDEGGRPMLVLRALNVPERVALRARGERGGFSAEDLDRAAHLLRDTRTGNEHPFDPHVLDLVYRVQVHFGAEEVRVVSGYRTPKSRRRSNHAKGRAIDLVVPGASDDEVARFAREQGFVGVGVYPVSGFVHLDVRERSYFWVDTSGPGKRSRTRGILADLAARSDAQAAARGERSVGPFLVGDDVEASLGSAALGASGAPEEEDTDEGFAP